MLLFVVLLPSNVMVAGLPLFGLLNAPDGLATQLLVPTDYSQAFHWLARVGGRDQVVLAPPQPSLWLPAYSPLRVVYGHPFETIRAGEKRAAVEAWYNGGDCEGLLTRYNVRFIVARRDGDPTLDVAWPQACLEALNLGEPAAQFGAVYVWRR
jgi:hypothetical protein